MAPELVTGLTAERVRRNLEAVRAEIGPDVEVVAATKYVRLEDLQAAVDGGVTLAGENRAQDLEAKAAAYPDLTFDFIGQLQSRKVRTVVPLVRRIHSVASDSAIEQLTKHWRDGLEVLLQVNIAAEEGKAGVDPGDVERYLDALPFTGLTIMPPLAETPEDSRRWFAAGRELAERHGLRHLSMGTTQDYAVAVEEGATCVRIGSRLYA